ncbi:DUF732 domain-containing protein [Mycolicibacterium sp. S3B2]|uniref:DUF732 domain-containing protein n=1 Tax=Mycolicibacterium sp. S3B2 TaxID=3415120 RepID=UPI003C7AD8E5
MSTQVGQEAYGQQVYELSQRSLASFSASGQVDPQAAAETSRLAQLCIGDGLPELPEEAPSAPQPEFSPAESAFLNNARISGITSPQGDQAIIDSGRAVCADFSAGASREAEADKVLAGQVGSVHAPNRFAAEDFVLFSSDILCPGAAPPVQAIQGPDCQKLAADYAALPTGTMDVLTLLRAMPGIGAIEPATLVGCGILADVSQAFNPKPGPAAGQQAGTGYCRGVEALAPFDLAQDFVCGKPAG